MSSNPAGSPLLSPNAPSANIAVHSYSVRTRCASDMYPHPSPLAAQTNIAQTRCRRRLRIPPDSDGAWPASRARSPPARVPSRSPAPPIRAAVTKPCHKTHGLIAGRQKSRRRTRWCCWCRSDPCCPGRSQGISGRASARFGANRRPPGPGRSRGS